ncbi:MAG TPA: hypothetical protein V6D17_02635 [Candidatus Obscuribacterales bacterium]
MTVSRMFCRALALTAAAVLAAVTVPASISATPNERKTPVFDLTELSVGTRFRLVENSDEIVTNEHVQYRFSLAGRFNLDGDGDHSIFFRLTTGAVFGNTWNNTGLSFNGSQDGQLDMAIRHLDYTVRIMPWLSLSAGSLEFDKGESSVITHFTQEGYFMGAKVRLMRPDLVWFDQMSLSVGYLGGLNDASVFDRLNQIGSFNYVQILIAKELGRVRLSADVTKWGETVLLHQAGTVRVAEAVVLDKVHIETYQRLTTAPDFGYALWGEKSIGKLAINVGYANIDPLFVLNDGKYGIGQRVFGGVSYDITQELSVRAYYTHAFNNDFKVGNAERFDLAVVYNFMPLIHK